MSASTEQMKRARLAVARVTGPEEITSPAPSEVDGVEDLGVRRDGDCYEMAAKYVGLAGGMGARAGSVLVHGVTKGPPGAPRMGHAWAITPEGNVYDGVFGKVFERETYYAWAGANEEVRYSPREARAKMVSTGNFGCWHETEGALGLDG